MAEQRPRQAFQFFTQQGWTPAQAMGIVGNLQQESGKALNPRAVGDNGASFGIAQWNRPAGRRDQLERFASDRGTDPSDFQTQLEFVQHEFETTESRAAERLRQTDTPEQAARATSQSYLRPGEPHLRQRIQNARQLRGLADDDSSQRRRQGGASENLTPQGELEFPSPAMEDDVRAAERQREVERLRDPRSDILREIQRQQEAGELDHIPGGPQGDTPPQVPASGSGRILTTEDDPVVLDPIDIEATGPMPMAERRSTAPMVPPRQLNLRRRSRQEEGDDEDSLMDRIGEAMQTFGRGASNISGGSQVSAPRGGGRGMGQPAMPEDVIRRLPVEAPRPRIPQPAAPWELMKQARRGIP